MSDPTPDEMVQAGFAARRLLADPVFTAAVTDLETQWITAWRAATDPAERDRYWHHLHALDAVRRALEITVTRGDAITAPTSRLAHR